MFGFKLAVRSFSARFSVAIVRQWRNVSGCKTIKLLCCRLSSRSWVCFWKVSYCSSDNSLFFKFKTLRFVRVLNDSLSMLRRRLHDMSKWVNLIWFWSSSGEKFVSLLSSSWSIRRHLKFFIACGWITKILFLLKSNSSKLDWCWSIRWQMMPMWLSCSETRISFFKGRSVSQWKSLIWLWLKFKLSRLPGPIKASLSTAVSWLFSNLMSLRIRLFRKSFGGSAVSSLLLKFTYCRLQKLERTSDESSFKPAPSKLIMDKFWNRWIISHGMVLNGWSCLMCKYLMFSSRMCLVLMMTFSRPMEILHASPNLACE